MTNFETRARTERYRVLARAAIRHNLRRLYLGHHQDDQIENFLMRLVPSEKGVMPSSALLGMQMVAPIPCCNDIFGAFDREPSTGDTDDSNVHLAHHGLSLIRPFLEFPKTRLIATCKTMGVPYVMDNTNLDPTTTRRNAVRHLLAKYPLPRALEKTFLIRTQEKLQEKIKRSIQVYKRAFYERLRINRFELGSGLLSVQFPDSMDGADDGLFASVAYMLEDLLDAVSPMPRGSVTVSANIVDSVLSVLIRGTGAVSNSSTKSAITVAGVLLEPSLRTLRLSRQPLRRNEHAKLTNTFGANSQLQLVGNQSWTDWLFWDNRYWLRIKLKVYEEASDYTVRAYTEADVAATKARFKNDKYRRYFEDSLDAVAPGKIKFTLPVIVKRGYIIAFPTLNIRIPDVLDDFSHDTSRPGATWQVRFKSQHYDIRVAYARANPDMFPTSALQTKEFSASDWENGPPDSTRHGKQRKVDAKKDRRWLRKIQQRLTTKLVDTATNTPAGSSPLYP